VSKDELHAIVGTEKGFIYRLKLSDFSKMLLKETHTSSVLSVVYPKGTSDKFITSSLDGSLRLWDVNDYIAITRCAVFSQGYPTCSDLTDEIIVSGWSDCKIRAFRVDNGEPIWAIDNAHKGGVSCIQLSSNLKFIISGGNEGDVRIWEIKSREMISHLKEHTSKVTGIKILSDNVHAISCSRDRSLLLWDLKAEKRLISIQQRMGGINSMALNNSEDSLLTVGQERRVCYWTFKSPTPIKTLLPSNNPNDEEEMLCIALSHSNKYFAAGGCKGFIRVWEYDTCKLICESKGHSFDINAISFSHDDKQVVTVGQDGIIFIWNLFLG
jgi:WD40 repeat protein